MILDANNNIRGKVIDLDTGLVVRKVIRLNTDTGYIKAYQVDAAGEIKRDAAGDYLTYEATGRFKFVPSDKPVVKGIELGAPKCDLCQSTMTLPGDVLCVKCRARERSQRNKMTCERIDGLEVGRKCERCSRDACWSVGDEVVVTPVQTSFRIERRNRRRVVVPDGIGTQQWSRGQMVGRRYFCSRHYKPPALLDARGEVIRELDVQNARPQY